MSSQTSDGRMIDDRIEYDRSRHFESGRRRVSWGALFAGLAVVVAVQLLLSALGAGVGLSMVHNNGSTTPNAGNFGLGAGVWWLVSNLIALLIGGYVAARLAGVAARFDGMLHGLVVWALATLFAVYLLTTAVGGVLGGAFNVMGVMIDGAGSTLKAAAAPVLQNAVAAAPVNVQSYLQPADPDPKTMSPQDAQKEVTYQLAIYEAGGTDSAAAKQQIIAIMAAQMNVSQDEATTRFNQLQQKVTGAKNQALKKAQSVGAETAQTTSLAAFLAFGMLLLGAIFGAIGGSSAAPRRPVTSSAVQ